MTASSQTAAPGRLADLLPGVIAATSFAISNVLSKIALTDGMDVLTLSVFRGLVGVVLVSAWLKIAPPPVLHTPRARWISLGLGVIFAGVVFGLFAAIVRVSVPIAILSYFVYPLITGFLGVLFGLERISWRGALAALAAFGGLALMIRANPEDIALAGIAFAFGSALCRTAILLITRATLQDADPQLTTWYTLLSSTAVLGLVALVTLNWHTPHSAGGWAALSVVSLGTTISVLALFISIKRIGPFRTALIMFLEPLLSTVFSAPILGEVIKPVQALGGAVMLAALVSFQLRR
ncbi:MAG: DMT family transporter [Xanthobacteraceae bacterium]|nr:DMT family transporter [Xanthobacteraceae bacterium]